MIISTQDNIQNYSVEETIGLVKGNTIRARHIGNDIIASFRTIIGGEVGEYTKLMAEAREQAIDRMIESARTKGANAIVGVRITSSMVMQGSSEILAYGTAVKINPN